MKTLLALVTLSVVACSSDKTTPVTQDAAVVVMDATADTSVVVTSDAALDAGSVDSSASAKDAATE